MANRIVRSLVGAVGVAASLALAPTAHGALYYQSTFDPFGFILNAIFEVDGCAGGPGWIPNNTSTCAVSMISAVATVTDYSDAARTNPIGSAYITFVNVSNPIGLSSIIASIYEDGSGQPAGIEWTAFNFIGPQPITSNADPNLIGLWGLNIYNWEKISGDGPPFDSVAYLLKYSCPGGFLPCGYYPRDSAVVVSDLTTHPSGLIPLGGVRPLQVDVAGNPIFRPDNFAPEPSSVALILGALGAGWLTRRRKVAA